MEGGSMRSFGWVLSFGLVCGFVCAQSPTDEQKLITIEQRSEKAFNSKDAQELAFLEQHTGDSVTNVDPFGHVTHETRAKVMEEMRHQDPGVETKIKLSDFHAHIYGDTAVVSYRLLFSASGNKNPILNVKEFPDACLDTFTKQNGEWYVIGGACAPTMPIPSAVYDAIKQMQPQQ
jgi:Domain of unknown function (DUF4440)